MTRQVKVIGQRAQVPKGLGFSKWDKQREEAVTTTNE
jgi:hypothetical protein